MQIKRHTNLLLLYIIATLTILVSCAKGGPYAGDETGGGGGPHEYSPSDTTAPVLTIYTPVNDQQFTNGNTINISGKITDDYALYRGSIKMVNDANGMNVLNQPYEIHGLLQYNFNLNHTAAITGPTNFTVIVSFEDHGYNSVTKSVKIKVNP